MLTNHVTANTRRDALTTYVIGIDPGVSTGLVIIRGDGFKMHAQQGTPSQTLDDFTIRFPFLVAIGITVLVACERFVVTDQTAKRSAQPVPMQVIGVVDQLARTHNWEFRLQAPSDAKAFTNNDSLRRMNLYTRPHDVEKPDANDVNDAMRHAVLMLAQRRASMYDKILLSASV